jgi:hypothetical protein
LNDLLNTSNVSTNGRKSSSRRLTADAADLENLWSELNESTASVNSSKSKKSAKKQKIAESIKLDDDSDSLAGSTFNLSMSTDMAKSSATPSGRRMTANVSDIANLIQNLDETQTSDDMPFTSNSKSHKSIDSGDFISPASTSDRRGTINASAIDAIVNSLDGELTLLEEVQSNSRRSSLSSLGGLLSASNSRRQTVDASALDAVMNHLNDSSLTFDEVNPMQYQFADGSSRDTDELKEVRNPRRDTVNPSDLDALMNHLDDTTGTFEESNPLVKKNMSSQKKSKSRRASLRSESSLNLSSLSSVSSMRRRTADPQDMEVMLKDLDTEEEMPKSSSKSKSRRSSLRSRRSSGRQDDRRVTANPADMAAMLDGIYDDDQENYFGNGRASEMMTGRESIDTVQLLHSVNDILQDSSTRKSADMSEVSDLIDLNDSVNVDTEQQQSNINLSTDTVNTMDLMTNIKDALGDLYPATMIEEDETHDSYTFINRLEDKMSPDDAAKPSLPSSSLKSILSSKKPSRQSKFFPTSARKSVAFGSPAAAEFNKSSPTTNFTPLDKEQAKAYFPKHFSVDYNVMVDKESEDEITAENSEILDQWDRLTNASGGSDEELYPIEEGESNTDSLFSPPGSNKRKSGKPLDSNSSKRSRRRKSTLISPSTGKSYSPLAYEDDGVADDGANISAIEAAETSFTVALPGNLMELMAQADVQKIDVDATNTSNTEDNTQELEGSLQTLMRHIDYGQHSIVYDTGSDVSAVSEKSTKSSQNESHDTSVSSQNHSLLSAAGLSFENITKKYGGSIIVDSDMSTEASTISNSSYASRSSRQPQNNIQMTSTYEEPSVTVELENKLGDILNKSALEDLSYSVEKQESSIFSDYGQTEELEGNIAEMVNCIASSPVPSQPMDQDFGVSSEEVQVESATQGDLTQATVKSNSDGDVHPLSKEVPSAATELRQRLKLLNENARRNTLTNCSQTPLPSLRSKSRLSVGYSQQRKSILPNTIETIESIPDDLVPLEENDLHEHISFADLLSKVSLLMTGDIHQPTGPSLSHIIEDSTRYFNPNGETQHLLADILSAATIEAGNHLQVTYSDKSINEAWDSFIHTAEYSLEDIEDMMALLRPQVEELVNFNWNLWESRLCDVANESIMTEVEAMRRNLHNLRKENDSLEQSLLADLSMAQPHTVNLQVIESNNEEEEIEIAKLEELDQLERSIFEVQFAINLANSLTYCKVKGMSTSSIEVDAIFSSTFHLSIIFSINAEDATIPSINVDIKQAENVSLEDNLASMYFANIMVDDAEIGSLSSNALNAVDKVTDIPNALHKVSHEHVLVFRHHVNMTLQNRSLVRFSCSRKRSRGSSLELMHGVYQDLV